MAPDNPLRIACIGFGEVGQTFARGLLATGGVRFSTYDRLFGQSAGQPIEAVASTLGVSSCDSAASAILGADIVISAVTADAAAEVALHAAEHLGPEQFFFDINSASPETKRRSALSVNATGARYIEGAVMAPVLKPGIGVPILTGGPYAAALSARLNALGMNLTPVAESYGKASAMKLCRSIIIKGLEALMLDCAAASAHWQVETEVFASLGKTFPGIDWRVLSSDMQERVATHGMRRSAEMREAAEMLGGLSRDTRLIEAVAAAQAQGARPKP